MAQSGLGEPMTTLIYGGDFGNGDTSWLGNWGLIPTLSFTPTPVGRSEYSVEGRRLVMFPVNSYSH